MYSMYFDTEPSHTLRTTTLRVSVLSSPWTSACSITDNITGETDNSLQRSIFYVTSRDKTNMYYKYKFKTSRNL